MDKSKKSFVVNAMRRASYRWYGRYQALAKYKLGRNEYFCNICGVIGGKKEYQLDHIVPVVPITGWDSFDGFVDRLFCDTSGYQLVCTDCHKAKSALENAERPVGDRAKGKRKKKT